MEDSNTTFIKAYVAAYKEGRTQTSVAEELGITPSAVSAKKKKLAEAGVELPKLKRATSTELDADALNAVLAAELK